MSFRCLTVFFLECIYAYYVYVVRYVSSFHILPGGNQHQILILVFGDYFHEGLPLATGRSC